MLKPHGFVVTTALLSLLWKKFPSDFFQSRLCRDRTERGALCDNWWRPKTPGANCSKAQTGFSL